MKKRTQYRSVSEMVRALSEDQTFTEEFTKRLSGRQLVKALTVLRARAGLSQQDLAEKLECTQSKVSKLESSADAGIRFGDLMDYTEAVGHEMRILLVPKCQGIGNEVKMHAFLIKRLLSRLVEQAHGDGAMGQAVVAFLSEAASNLTRLLEVGAAGLPALPEEPGRPIQVEALDLENVRGVSS